MPVPRLIRIFGLTVETDLEVPGAPLACGGEPDVRVRREPWPDDLAAAVDARGEPHYTSPFVDGRGQPFTRAWTLSGSGAFHLEMNDGCRFAVDRDGRHVWVDARAASGDSAEAYLCGPVLGVVLRRRGIVCLHASAVAMEGRSIAIAGGQGAGKSTLAVLLCSRGARIVTDDLLALRESAAGFFGHAGPARLRLRAEGWHAIRDLSGPPGLAEPGGDGRYVDWTVDVRPSDSSGSVEPRPLQAIYYLDSNWSPECLGDDRGLNHRAVEPWTGADALMGLLADTWATRWLSAGERVGEFRTLAELMKRVPVYRLPAPSSTREFLALAQRLEADARAPLAAAPMSRA